MVVLIWQTALSGERTALLRLPETERGAFFERTFHNVHDLCDPSRPTLRHYCTEQADLLADLPECGDECQALIRPLLPQPTR